MAKHNPNCYRPGTFRRISYRGEDRQVFVLSLWEGRLHVLSTSSLPDDQREFLRGKLEEAQDAQEFYRSMPEDLKPFYRTLLPQHIGPPSEE